MSERNAPKYNGAHVTSGNIHGDKTDNYGSTEVAWKVFLFCFVFQDRVFFYILKVKKKTSKNLVPTPLCLVPTI